MGICELVFSPSQHVICNVDISMPDELPNWVSLVIVSCATLASQSKNVGSVII